MFKKFAALAFVGLLASATAHAASFTFQSGDGQVILTPGTNQVTVKLTSLVANPNDDSLHSAVFFSTLPAPLQVVPPSPPQPAAS